MFNPTRKLTQRVSNGQIIPKILSEIILPEFDSEELRRIEELMIQSKNYTVRTFQEYRELHPQYYK